MLMKHLLFLLCTSVILHAQAIQPTSIDLQIINYTFNEQFDEATKISQEQIKLAPSSPKYYYYLINIKILEYYQKVAELDPEKRGEGRKILNKEIIEYCEGVINKLNETNLNLENKFYYGSIHAYLARIYGVDASWWSAFRSGKKAKNIMEEIIKSNPQFHDAYLVLGMINYYADRMSGVTGFIAGVLGLSGDREKGLNYLQTAFDKAKLTFGQSALTLIEVYTSLEGNEYAALPYFEKFLDKYPNNKRTLNAYCQTLMNIWELDKVERLLNNDTGNLIDDFARARFYDIKGDSRLAIQFGEKALQNEKKLYRGGADYSRYIIVVNSLLIGDNKRVEKYEALLDERFSERYLILKNNPGAGKWVRELSIRIANNNSVSELEQYLKTKPNLKTAGDYEEQFNLLVGTHYFNNRNYSMSEQYFLKNITASEERNKTRALTYLVEIYSRQTVDKVKVKKLLAIIEDTENNRLTYRSKDLERKYNL